jgi:hypothetical protein
MKMSMVSKLKVRRNRLIFWRETAEEPWRDRAAALHQFPWQKQHSCALGPFMKAGQSWQPGNAL